MKAELPNVTMTLEVVFGSELRKLEWSAQHIDKIERRFNAALSFKATHILRRRLLRAPSSTANLKAGRETFQEIVIRFIAGHGHPLADYADTLHLWNIEDDREFAAKLGRAIKDGADRLFDRRELAMIFFWDQMPFNLPPLSRWRDEAATGWVQYVNQDLHFTLDAYRSRLKALGFIPEKPALIKGGMKGYTLEISRTQGR
jgi:hypothetical protein